MTMLDRLKRRAGCAPLLVCLTVTGLVLSTAPLAANAAAKYSVTDLSTI